MSTPDLDPLDSESASAVHQETSRWRIAAATLAAGVAAGFLGTSLHGHALFLTGSQTPIPYGAGLALLFLGAVCVYMGLWSRSVWPAVLCGGVAYIMAGIFSAERNGGALIFGNLQGRLWVYGIIPVILLAALLVRLLLRRERRS